MRGTDVTNFKRQYRERNEGDFPQELTILLRKEFDLKYGENPAQHGAVYIPDQARKIAELTNIVAVRSDKRGKGGLSLTNIMDIARAMDNLKFFPGPAVVIMKHNLVSGFAKDIGQGVTQTELFRLARDADLQSNFGGTVAFNEPVNRQSAEALYELRGENPFFVDVLVAPGYEEGVLGYIEKQSKNVRIAEFSHLDKLPKFQGDETYGLLSIKEIPGGRIGIQDIYLPSIKSVDDLVLDPKVIDKDGKAHVVEWGPTRGQVDDMLTAWYLNVAGARSNGIVAVREGVSVAIGAGKVERVGAVKDAITQGMQKAMDREGIDYDLLMGIQGYEQLQVNPFEGAACSSDGFFPFPDSIDLLARVGVKAVIQPFGSNGDAEVIDAANNYEMAMVATGERCFGHF